MTKSLTTKNFAAVVLGLGLVLALSFSFAPVVKAQSVGDLQAQIQALLAQIAAMQGGSTPSGACFTFTMNLTVGASNNEVMQLQKFLNSHGYAVAASGAGSAGNETMYFGSMTAAAVAKFQAANGISPAAGYFGPITRAKVNSMCMGPVTPGPVTPGSPSPSPAGPLQGGAGSINDADYVSGLNNEEVGEDAEDVEVAGLELEADDGSDLELTAVQLNFSPSTGVAASDDFEEYADEVSIWLDGEELARVDADMFEDDDNFDRTISLDRGGIIRAGDTGDLVVAVSGISNLDSDFEGDTWKLEFESVRVRDAQGATITDSSTGDINDGTGRNFTFETFASAEDVELKAKVCDDTPEGVVNIDNGDDTDGVDLLCFTLEADGGDIHLENLPINFASTTGGNADVLSDFASTVYVTIGSDEWSESGSSAVQGASGATVTFDDFEYDLEDGDEVEVMVSADIQDTSGDLNDGDALTASFTASNRNVLVAEDETGEDLGTGSSDRSGTGLGEAVAFYDVGIMVSLVSVDEEITNDNTSGTTDTGEFTIVFNVEAFDGTVYVSDNADPTTATSIVNSTIDENLYRLNVAGTASAGNLSEAISYTTNDGASDSTNGNIKLEDGESTEISLVASRTNTGVGGIMQAFLMAIAWDTTDETYSNGSDLYNVFDFDLEDYKTGLLSVN